jgi:light-regulated signal transduction histidine kinase (bacteriophytochrome)
MSAIQPCALLLLVGPDWRVETVSANVAMLGDFRPANVVGQPLADLIGSKAIHTLRNRVSWLASDESEVQDFGVQWGDLTLDVRATCEGEHYLIEAELAVEPRLPDGIGIVRSMTDRLSGGDPRDMAEQGMRQLHSLTGFDQVLLCDRQGNFVAGSDGEESGMPTAAVSLPRLVADRDAEPVPLVGDEQASLISRAAYLAPGHGDLESLAGDDVAATMALPLRIDGELVGTIHARHSSPRRCGAERRSVAHLFAERLAARMARHGWQP